MQSIEQLRKLAMVDREQIELTVRRLLDLRAQNSFDEMAKLLSPHCVLDIVGDPRFFAYAGRLEGRDEILAVIKRVNTEIDYLDFEIRGLLIDHDHAFCRRRVHVRHRGTGISLDHEIWDEFRFEGGLVVEWTMFIDISAYNRLQGGN